MLYRYCAQRAFGRWSLSSSIITSSSSSTSSFCSSSLRRSRRYFAISPSSSGGEEEQQRRQREQRHHHHHRPQKPSLKSIEKATLKWLDQFIIEKNVCPFAKNVRGGEGGERRRRSFRGEEEEEEETDGHKNSRLRAGTDRRRFGRFHERVKRD